MKRAVLAVLLIAFLVLSAQATLFSQRHLLDVRLPVLLIGAVAAAPGWLFLLLAARARGAPWRWLGVAVAWGALAVAWIAFVGEAILVNVLVAVAPGLEPLGDNVVQRIPATLIAPLVEEPAKAAGALIVLAGIRRAGARISLAMGAAVGGLVGVWFGVAEASHHLGAIVDDIGFTDLNGVFVVDPDVVRGYAELELVQRLFLAGLTNHGLFSALAGVAIALLWQGRGRAAVGWFGAALLTHAMFNSVGREVGTLVFDALARTGTGERAVVPSWLLGWLTAAAAFVVAEAWAAIILIRRLRRTDAAKLAISAEPDPA